MITLEDVVRLGDVSEGISEPDIWLSSAEFDSSLDTLRGAVLEHASVVDLLNGRKAYATQVDGTVKIYACWNDVD